MNTSDIWGWINFSSERFDDCEEELKRAQDAGLDEADLKFWKTLADDWRNDVTAWSERLYENHWYIPIPFTNRRLIFSGLRYVGWYIYK